MDPIKVNYLELTASKVRDQLNNEQFRHRLEETLKNIWDVRNNREIIIQSDKTFCDYLVNELSYRGFEFEKRTDFEIKFTW